MWGLVKPGNSSVEPGNSSVEPKRNPDAVEENVGHGSRPKDNFYMVLIGVSGGGKSTTLNVMFDRYAMDNLDSELVFRSNTKEIEEYKIISNIPRTSKGDIIVIDTPGFQDTEGQDSQIMATLGKYLDDHSELQNCFPSVVMLFLKFDDVQVNAENSYFIRFLIAVNHMAQNRILIDSGPETCNLMIVFTHLMNDSSHAEQLEHKKALVLGLIRAYTSIPTTLEIVLAENKGKSLNLEERGGHWVLPNQELYPLNLFEGLIDVSRRGLDRSSTELIEHSIQNSLKFKKDVDGAKRVQLLAPNHQDCLTYKNIVNGTLSTPGFNFEVTPMSRLIDDNWENIIKFDHDSGVLCNVVKAAFYDQNILTVEEIPRVPAQIVRILQQLPMYKPVQDLIKSLDINVPKFDCRSVGHFLDLQIFKVSESCIWQSKNRNVDQIGFLIPDYLKIYRYYQKDRDEVILHRYPTYEAYEKNFLMGAGIHNEKNLQVRVPAGVNIRSDRLERLSARREFRVYTVNTAKNPKEGEVQVLPREFVRGSYVVSSAILGGYIELVAKRKIDDKEHEGVENVEKTMIKILRALGKPEVSQDLFQVRGWKLSLKFVGGNKNLARPKLSQAFGADGSEDILTWIESIMTNPNLLVTGLKLTRGIQILADDCKINGKDVIRNVPQFPKSHSQKFFPFTFQLFIALLLVLIAYLICR